MILLLLLTLQFGSSPTPAELADMAAELFLNGQYAQASEIWNELRSRMPHRSRIAYNLAASRFMMDSLAAADSSLSLVSGDVEDDTLACAEALTDLALAIQMNDYSGVENTVSVLMENISDGVSPECERIGLEAGLNWLHNHEPPEDQQDQDQQDQDQQDQNEDQQDQNEDQQDQNEDQQDQNEDQQGQNEDQQDQNEEQPRPPPQIDEMTPEQAQAILDLIEENLQPEDSTGTAKTGRPSGPVW
ncbi:MAG: hypothetical protein KAT09_02015 [Candidatus Aegiribacteria sp.]|nr:hypothetical protein [Candidatus Aegiribacteria sp.]